MYVVRPRVYVLDGVGGGGRGGGTGLIEVGDFGDSTTDTVGGVNYFYHLRGVRGGGRGRGV